MRAYTQLLIQTCHRRGVHAMGGMAAQIPIKDDPEANEAALDKVRADKLREVSDGHDGTWVAHPGAGAARARGLRRAHARARTRSTRQREDVQVTPRDLLARARRARAPRTACATTSTSASSTSRPGCAASAACRIYNLMEDAATAEISRTQVWQWIHHRAAARRRARGRRVELVRELLDEELERIREAVGPERFAAGHFAEARELFERLVARRRAARGLPDPAGLRAAARPTGDRVDQGVAHDRSRSAHRGKDAQAAARRTRWAGDRPALLRRPTSSACAASLRIEHTLAELGRASGCGSCCTPRTFMPRARRAHRQPGGADGPRRAQGDLRQRLAGGRRRQHCRADLPRPEPLPGRQRARRWCAASTTPCSAPTRSSTPRARDDATTGSRRSSPTPRPASAARSTPSS